MVSIILGNCHVLFELPGKLALQWGWPPHFRLKQEICIKMFFQAFVLASNGLLYLCYREENER